MVAEEGPPGGKVLARFDVLGLDGRARQVAVGGRIGPAQPLGRVEAVDEEALAAHRVVVDAVERQVPAQEVFLIAIPLAWKRPERTRWPR